MMRLRRAIVAAGIAAGAVVGLLPGVAAAAAPTNDEYTGAVVVQANESVAFDNSQANTEDIDRQFDGYCFAPPIEKSVWFTWTPDETSAGRVSITVDSTAFGPGLVVLDHAPDTPFGNAFCDFGNSISFYASGGTTYYILVFDRGLTGGGAGTLTVAPTPAPKLTVAIGTTGSVDSKTGIATIPITYDCENSSEMYVTGTFRQVVGRLVVSGPIFTGFPCVRNGVGSLTLASTNGKLGGGKIELTGIGYTCLAGCVDQQFATTAQLKANKK